MGNVRSERTAFTGRVKRETRAMGKLGNTMREDCGTRRTLGARNSGFRGTRPDSLNSIQKDRMPTKLHHDDPLLARYGKKITRNLHNSFILFSFPDTMI